ncbi:MAG: biotin--[acetyl-CoA-carboxylase] ligase [Bacteroidota bacterium]
MELSTHVLGQQVIHLSETSSTNTLAYKLLKDAPPEGTLIITDDQYAGKGQATNIWHAEAGKNLTFSLILHPTYIPSFRVFVLNKLSSLAVWKGLKDHLPNYDLQVKWPNDVLLQKRKVAGILVENIFEGSKLKTSIIGMGINVNQLHFPPALQNRATSMGLEASYSFDLIAVLDSVLVYMETMLDRLQQNPEALDRDYHDALYGYQELIPLEVDGVEMKGTILGCRPDGKLGVQFGSSLRYFDMKEIRFPWFV